MTKRERLAAHLFNMYWTGVHDEAEHSDLIYNYHENMLNKHAIEQALVDGHSMVVVGQAQKMTQTEYFMILADLMLADLEKCIV